MALLRRAYDNLRHPLSALGIPHPYISYSGYLCWARREGRVWHTRVLWDRRVWRER